MADPLSIAAGVAGLISIAASISTAAYRYIREAKDADAFAEQLAEESLSLSGILHQLAIYVSVLQDGEGEKSAILPQIQACKQTLIKIDNRFTKLRRAHDKRSRLGSLQAKLAWPLTKSETTESIESLARHKQTLLLALSAKSLDALVLCLSKQDRLDVRISEVSGTLQAVKSSLDGMTMMNLDAEKRKVLDFFLRVNPQPQFETSCKLRFGETNKWLLESDQFQHFLSVPGARLWLHGIPGSGKTVMAGAVI